MINWWQKNKAVKEVGSTRTRENWLSDSYSKDLGDKVTLLWGSEGRLLEGYWGEQHSRGEETGAKPWDWNKETWEEGQRRPWGIDGLTVQGPHCEDGQSHVLVKWKPLENLAVKNSSGYCFGNVEEANAEAEGWWWLGWRRLKNRRTARRHCSLKTAGRIQCGIRCWGWGGERMGSWSTAKTEWSLSTPRRQQEHRGIRQCQQTHFNFSPKMLFSHPVWGDEQVAGKEPV